jgi:hypothetical protein
MGFLLGLGSILTIFAFKMPQLIPFMAHYAYISSKSEFV